jgi:multidrug efflux pump subunit AcrA (membrane-fusion protein)
MGQPPGVFISAGHNEFEAGGSYTDAEILRLGRIFEMQDSNTGKQYKAKVVRINDQVDPATQQVKVYAGVDDPEARSGIYLEGRIPAGEIKNAVEIPISALVGENEIFTIVDSTAKLIEVEVAYKNSEKAIISGISESLEVVMDKHNESLDGSKVAPVNIEE